tara:strand:- start:1474 stop:1860 length:387 start_codon:yes stop_codon:yes gene_type:complete
MLKLNVMKRFYNVIPLIQDKSILNIILYTLENNHIRSDSFESAIKTNNISPSTLILLDKDFDDIFTKNVLKTVKDQHLHPCIILAINKNYRYFLSEPLNPLISGILYKPFEIEELFQILTIDNHAEPN